MTDTDTKKPDTPSKETPARVNPYVGPRPFQPGEELFGRDREKRDLFDQILAERIVLLHSPSGAGKTSLINAGLLPLLRQESLQVLPVVRVGEEPPARYASQEGFNRFLFSMMLSLEGELSQPAPTQAEGASEKGRSEEELAEQEAQRLAHLDQLAGMPFKEYITQRRGSLEGSLHVIVFDQFEEIITTAPTDLRSKQEFFRQIGDMLSDRSLWALFVIRDDYLGALESYALSVPTQLTNTFRLDLLGSQAAQQAIQKPVARQGISFLDSAAEKLVDDMRVVQIQAPGGEIVTRLGLYVEPVQLQVVCLRLYDQLDMANRLDKTQIDDEDIKNVGDVGTALANYYAERVAAISGSPTVERQVRDWFDGQLVTKSGLRSQVMMEVGSSGGLDNELIRQLGKAHLVRAEKRRGVTWFELAHDRLVRPVQRDNERWRRENLNAWQLRAVEWQKNGQPDSLLLRGVNLDQALVWAEQNPAEIGEVDDKYLQSSVKWRETHLSPLQRKAAEWESHGRPPNLLLGGSDLQQASEWAMANTDEITSRELEFLDASRAAAQEAERQQREQAMQLEFERQRADEQEKTARRLRVRAIALGVATVIALVMFLLAMGSLYSALENARENAVLASENEAYGNTQSALRVTSDAFGNAQGTLAAEGAEVARQRSTQAADNAALAAAQSTLSAERQQQAAINARIALTALAQEATAVFNAGQALSRQLASQARSLQARRPELGILLGVEAYRADPLSWDARSVLLEGLRTGLEQSVVPYELNMPSGQVDTNNVEISQDGKRVVWSGSDGDIMIWDVATRSARILKDPEGIFVTAQALSPTDPNLLVTGNNNSQLLFWDLSDGTFDRVRAIGTTATGTRYNHSRVRRLEFSPDGNRLAIHGQTANIAIWDVQSRSELLSFKNVPDFYWDLAWSPDPEQRYLAAAGGDNRLYVFDTATGNRIVQQANPDTDGRIYNVDWSPDPDSQIVAFVGASGSRFARVNFYDMSTRKLLDRTLQSASSTLYTLSYNHPRGDLIVAAGNSTPVEIWRLSDGSKYPPLPTYGDFQNGLSFKNDLLAYLGLDTISVYELKDPQPLSVQRDPFAGRSPVVAVFGADDVWIAGTSAASILLEQRAGEQTQPLRLSERMPGAIADLDIVISPQRSLYLLPGASGDVYRWDPAADSLELLISGISDSASALAVSQDGSWLAAGFCKEESVEQFESLCSIRLYDLGAQTAVGEAISTTQSTLGSLAFSPDGRTLASGDQAGLIYLIDTTSGQVGELPLGGFSVSFTSLAFSPDGSTLASGTDQGLLLLWDIASGQVFDKPFQSANLPLTGLAYAPDGKRLYAAFEDGTVSIWDVDYESWVQRACAIAGRSLTRDEWRQFLGDEEYAPACQENIQANTTPAPASTPAPTATPTP